MAGCVGGLPLRDAIYRDPAFLERTGISIYVLPTIDRRMDTSAKVDMYGDIGMIISNMLIKRGYNVHMVGNFSACEKILSEQVAEMIQDELYDLGPQDAQSMMLIYLDDVSENYSAIAYTYKVEMTGILLDKHNKTLLWKDKGVCSRGQGGLMSAAIAKGTMKKQVFEWAIYYMLGSFPSKLDPDTVPSFF